MIIRDEDEDEDRPMRWIATTAAELRSGDVVWIVSGDDATLVQNVIKGVWHNGRECIRVDVARDGSTEEHYVGYTHTVWRKER